MPGRKVPGSSLSADFMLMSSEATCFLKEELRVRRGRLGTPADSIPGGSSAWKWVLLRNSPTNLSGSLVRILLTQMQQMQPTPKAAFHSSGALPG